MKCQFIKTNGEVCKANHMKRSSFCFRHDPASSKATLVASSKGGQNRRLQDFYGQEIVLKSPADVKGFIGQVINAVWTGSVPVQVGSSMGFLTRCWLDAHEASEVTNRLDQLERRLEKAGL